MTPETGRTTGLLGRMMAGDEQARNDLIAYAGDRLQALTRYMLDRFPGVRDHMQTGDVLNNVLIRLMKALAEIAVPSSSAHWWNIANQHIRWELLGLARYYKGQNGLGANQQPDSGEALDRTPDPSGGPSTLDGWTHFHESVERLPDAERETFGLIWYAGLTHEEAAAQLGISLSTLKRRWQSARMLLDEAMNGEVLT